MADNIQSLVRTSCSGCGMCSLVCTRKAIVMEEDREGFLYPRVDKDLCNICGLCLTLCPEVHPVIQDSSSQRAYLANAYKGKHYKSSATTGVCTMLSERTIAQGGVVYGAELDEKAWKVRHVAVKDKSGLERIRNSKYLQSELYSCLSDAKTNLENGVLVLFIGTPCQIAALKAYLKKDYTNLMTVDLICHGTFSYRIMREEVLYWEKRIGSSIHNFKFRSKRCYPWTTGGVVNFDFRRHGIKRHVECQGSSSPTYYCYAYSKDGKNYNLRPSCYTCQFRDRGRYGDITVGDSWFVSEYYQAKLGKSALQSGISLILANTERGSSAVARMKDDARLIEIPVDQAFVQPALLYAHREIPAEREQIYGTIGKGNYDSRINELFGIDLWNSYKRERRHLMKKRFRRILNVPRIWYCISGLKDGFKWWFTNSLICNFPSIRFRGWCLRKMGLKMSKNVRLYAGFHIRSPQNIIIEDGVSIGPKVLLDGRNGLTIKKSAVIGYEAIIWTLNHDYNDVHFCGKGAPVEIGEYAWVCSRAIVLPGIRIGKGAVVASNAVVTKDVPDFAIVAGIPAKVIGKREEKPYDYGFDPRTSNEHFS